MDLDAIADLAVATAETMRSERLTLLELNPVIATPAGAIAVDALARRPTRTSPFTPQSGTFGLSSRRCAVDLVVNRTIW